MAATAFEPVTSSFRVRDAITVRANLSDFISRIKL